MQAILIDAPDKLVHRGIPELPITDYQARTRLICGSICNSTDRKLLAGTFPGCVRLPAVLGHEAVGEVVAVGAKVRNYHVGDLVIRPYQHYRETPGGPDLGIVEYFGSFGEFGRVIDRWAQWEDGVAECGDFGHPQQVLPPGTDPAVGVMSITLKETLSWTRRFGIGPGQTVLVVGTGPVGASFALWSKQAGAEQVLIAGRTPSSMSRAAELSGVDATVNVSKPDFIDRIKDLSGGGVDRIIEAVGDNTIIDWGVGCLTENGQIGIYGVPPSTQDKPKHAADPRIRWISPDEAEVHDEFFNLATSGAIDPMRFMSDRMLFDEIEHGFALLDRRKAFKVLLDW